jgi:hypothetical protein
MVYMYITSRKSAFLDDAPFSLAHAALTLLPPPPLTLYTSLYHSLCLFRSFTRTLPSRAYLFN